MAANGNTAYIAYLNSAEEVGISKIGLRRSRGVPLEQVKQSEYQKCDNDPERDVLTKIQQLVLKLYGGHKCWQMARAAVKLPVSARWSTTMHTFFRLSRNPAYIDSTSTPLCKGKPGANNRLSRRKRCFCNYDPAMMGFRYRFRQVWHLYDSVIVIERWQAVTYGFWQKTWLNTGPVCHQFAPAALAQRSDFNLADGMIITDNQIQT